jgi:hypothetical protein
MEQDNDAMMHHMEEEEDSLEPATNIDGEDMHDHHPEVAAMQERLSQAEQALEATAPLEGAAPAGARVAADVGARRARGPWTPASPRAMTPGATAAGDADSSSLDPSGGDATRGVSHRRPSKRKRGCRGGRKTTERPCERQDASSSVTAASYSSSLVLRLQAMHVHVYVYVYICVYVLLLCIWLCALLSLFSRSLT